MKQLILHRVIKLCVAIVTLALGVPIAFAQDKTPVVLGFVTPITSTWGVDVMRGANLAMKQVTASGGVLGHPVKLVAYDDQMKPEEGVAAVERLITRDKAKIIMGSFASSVTMAEQAVTKRYNKLLIASFAQAEDVRNASYPMAFFLNSTLNMGMTSYLKYIASHLKPQRVVVIADSSDYGQAAIDAIKKNWSTQGDPKIVGIERFELGQGDLSPQITRIKSLHPDAIFIAAGSGEGLSNVLTQLNDLGVQGKRLGMPGGTLSESFLKLAGKAAEGLMGSDLYFYGEDSPQNIAFVKAFKDEYKYNPNLLEMIGYESIMLSVQLLQKTGLNTSDATMAQVLRENVWNSPRGTLKFVPMGKAYQAEAQFQIETVKDGKAVLVR